MLCKLGSEGEEDAYSSTDSGITTQRKDNGV